MNDISSRNGKKILELKVYLDDSLEVKGRTGQATMVIFHGEVESEWFCGKTLSNSVDTQTIWPGQPWQVSARYILEGTDKDGNPCRMFVENNGGMTDNGEGIYTIPRILTDSAALQWLEDADLYGRVEGKEDYISIKIFQDEGDR